ncbi:DUF1758 domain-containing protein [Trichonephila clavipes]|nr:DUF1758 domain-containing protein [Trichonephila clavipes]
MNSDSENECLIEDRSSEEDFLSSERETDYDCLDSARDCLAKDDEIEGYILEKQELLDTWEEMLILLERRVSHLNKTNKSTEVIHTRNSDSTEIKLPTLSLPTFSGVIDEWLTFSDLFQAAVTNNQNLTGAQKLQYLKGDLKGDAQKIVQSLPITVGPNSPNVNNPSITSCSGFDSNSQVLLCTALVNVCDFFGGTRLCRVLLDPGSQACLITSSCLERLGLPRKRTNVRISCLGASDTRTNRISEIKFTPHFTSNISFVTSVYVVNKIVGQLPHFSLDSSWSEPFSDLKLADPTFLRVVLSIF